MRPHPHRQLPRPPAPGFSLLEAIVTLVVVAMIVTLLMQALAQSLDLRARLLRHQRHMTLASLQEQWFRDTVSSALTDLPEAFGEMHGSAESLELVTPVPLGGTGIGPVGWTLQPVQGGWELHYADATWPDLVVIEGPLHDAAFAYLDGAGAWQDEWAPEPEATEVLPRMVRLQARTATGELAWLVPIAADPARPRFLRPQDPVNGL